MSSKERDRKVFTTGQVAKICQVAPRTVSKWFDSGRLGGYRIPGSQDRRIPREKLIRFLKENSMPLNGLEQEGWHKILVIGAEPLFIERLGEMLPEDDDYRIEIAFSAFTAGEKIQNFLPDTIIIDHAMGRHDAISIAKALKANETFNETLIIALASEDEPEPELLETNHGFAKAFKKPFDIALLAEHVRTLATEKRER